MAGNAPFMMQDPNAPMGPFNDAFLQQRAELANRIYPVEEELNQLQGFESDYADYYEQTRAEYEELLEEWRELTGNEWVSAEEEQRDPQPDKKQDEWYPDVDYSPDPNESSASSGSTSSAGDGGMSMPDDGGMSSADDGGMSMPDDGGMSSADDGGMSRDDSSDFEDEEGQQSIDPGQGQVCDPDWWNSSTDYGAPAAGVGESVMLSPEILFPEQPSSDSLPTISGTDCNQLARVINPPDGASYVALRLRPDRSGKEIKQLHFNDRLFVVRKLDAPGWCLATTDAGDVGFVWAPCLMIGAPEPDAVLHYVEPNQSAIGIAERYYKDAVGWGHDLRFYVNVMVYANRSVDKQRAGLRSDNEDWSEAKTYAGKYIWIPDTEFADAVRDKVSTGSISFAIWSALLGTVEVVFDAALAIIGFIGGLVHGVLECVWDTLKGFVELIGMLWDLLVGLLKLIGLCISGEIVNATASTYQRAKQIWEALSWELVGDLISKTVAGWIDGIKEKWEKGSWLERGHFVGWVIGYIIAEVVIAIYTAGGVTAVKLTGRLAEFVNFLRKFKPLEQVIVAAEESLEKAAEFRRLRLGLKIHPGIVHKCTSGAKITIRRDKTTTILGVFKEDLELIMKDLGELNNKTPGSIADVLKTTKAGKVGGLNFLNVGKTAELEAGTQWFEKVNGPWLKAVIERGDDIILVSRPGYMRNASGQLRTFGMEIEFLIKNGLRPSLLSTKAVRLPGTLEQVARAGIAVAAAYVGASEPDSVAQQVKAALANGADFHLGGTDFSKVLTSSACEIAFDFDVHGPASFSILLRKPGQTEGLFFYMLRHMRHAIDPSVQAETPAYYGRLLNEYFSDLLAGDFSISAEYQRLEPEFYDKLLRIPDLPPSHPAAIKCKNFDISWMQEL